MRKQSFDEELARLRKVARGEMTAEAVEVLREALKGSQNVLAALAAQIAGHRGVSDLGPDLVRAFDKFMTATDKVCQAKIAIVAALDRLEYWDDDVCLRGIKHVQKEPAFGGPVDVAADLRAGCAVMLANMRHPDAHLELTNLLVDPEVNPRKAAIKALAHLGTEAAEAVIRLKALTGDKDPEVIGECFSALMSFWPNASMRFVGRFLESDDLVVAEQAALALGQSHEDEAFRILREHWENNLSPEFRRMLLLPISLLRRDDAFEFLVEVVETCGPKLAAGAVSVLGVYASDKSRRRVRDVVEKRGDRTVSEAFTREFGSVE